MTGLILAWMVGEGIMTYRIVTQQSRPPLPGELLASSGLYVLLGFLAEAQSELASLLAWGINLAALLNLWPIAPKVVENRPPAPSGTVGSTEINGRH